MDIIPATATGAQDELEYDARPSDSIADEGMADGSVADGSVAGESAGAAPKPGTGFGDHKAPGAFRTIGEVAQALGIRQHVLRYWEEQFPTLTPVKRSGNRRYYRPEDVALIEQIDRLVHREGYTLRGARLALEPAPRKAKRGQGHLPAADATPAPPSALLDELLTIRATLAAALAA